MESGQQTDKRDEFLRQLGRLALNFSGLEGLLQYVSLQLMGAEEEVGWIVVSQLPFPRLVAVARTLLNRRISEESVRQRFVDILRRAEESEKERNTMMHSIWMYEGHESPLSRVKVKIGRGRLEMEPVLIDPDAISALATRALETSGALGQFAIDHKLIAGWSEEPGKAFVVDYFPKKK